MSLIHSLEGINIELTTCCPLHCPQCYCSLQGGKHISKDIAIKAMKQAAELGAKHVELSGGETMCYPYIYEIISVAKKIGLMSSIAISGWDFDSSSLLRLIDSGIDSIYVSLNAPTEELNAVTRDGFALSIAALETLKENHFQDTTINWVMHRNVADMLPEMIELAKQYEVGTILIIEPMPTSKGDMNTYPTKEQLLRVAEIVKKQEGHVRMQIQHCFSPLLAVANDNKLWGNFNRGIYKGCTAGIASCSINVDGLYTPCRHLAIPEAYNSLSEYWTNSAYLNQLRNMDKTRCEPCQSCKYSCFCRHCQAYNWSSSQSFFLGRNQCELFEKKNEQHTIA